ncbi:hypothetical protein [Planktotalea sp.]|uniref:hypothetical protein n=1 Tax=Planktotalea sp. TaxID=2029877 RepID=UPI003D6AB3D7
MLAKPLFTLLALSLGSIAQASCFDSGTPLFHCTFENGSKTADVCLQGEVVVYSFGNTGQAPDMIAARREIGVEMTPWNGIGRSIYEDMTIYNNVYSYILSYEVDRNVESAPILGRLIVAEGDSEIADFACDKGSVTEANFYPLFEAKDVAGQKYCPETFSWGAGC